MKFFGWFTGLRRKGPKKPVIFNMFSKIFGSHPDRYEIQVQTRDIKKAGTDNSVYCAFIGTNEERTGDLLLNKTFVDDLENGQLEHFEFPDEKDIGEIAYMELWMDADLYKDDLWFCEYITCVRHSSGKAAVSYPFPLHRWIKPGKKYIFEVFDSCLPQDEKCEARKKFRAEELAENKVEYKFVDDSDGLPKTTAKLPDKEVFSSDYLWDITARKAKLLVGKTLKNLFTSSKWEDFQDIKNLYEETFFNVPRGWYNWKCDFKFGDQRLNGVNDYLLHKCTKIPENFPVTNDMVKDFLGGKMLEGAMEEGRIFIEDLKVLEGVPQKDGARICAPLGLFFANEQGELVPIAIQLNQVPSEDNPIFFPSDPEYKWLLVKMFFNNSDCCVHQSTTHLAFTHLVCETVAASAAQSLSQSHPVQEILAPHFIYLFAINSRAVGKLIAPGEWIDQTMSMGADGLKEIVRRRWKTWRMDDNGWFPNNIVKRGVDDTKILPSYYARDDKLVLHEAIEEYVRDVLTNVYDRAEKLRNDHEVQEFARILSAEEGAGIKGVFGGGKFDDVEDLVKVVTATIFIASVGHAAANFGQYDEYAFVPVYPAKLHGEVPKDKSPIALKDIMSYLPDKDMTLSIMVVTKLLSERSTQALGDYETKYLYEPRAIEALKRFQQNLKDIGKKIDARNRKVKNPYPYLHPGEIPNAISI